MPQEKFLITGGTGFIGVNLVHHLIELGHEVIVWSRSPLESSTLEDLKNRIKFQQVDLLDEEAVKKKLLEANPTLIVHLASFNNNSLRTPSAIKPMLKDNVETAVNLYSAALELKELKCIITTGSAAENELNEAPFNEEQKEKPASPYGLSKACLSYLSSYFYRWYKLPIVVVRLSQVYGKHQINGFVPAMITKCLRNETIDTTSGEQSRDFVYIKDVIRAFMLIVENPQKVQGEIINISTGKETKIKDATLLIKQMTGSASVINFGAVPYRPGDNMHFCASYAKAKRLLGWEPEYSFEKGLEETVEWWKAHVELQ